MPTITHDWTTERVEALYHLPLTELLFRAQTVHREYHNPESVQRCTLLSIKTGGCPEDCAYCPQSARYDTGVDREELMKPESVLSAAQQAREQGSTRFCMGAAWREVHDGACPGVPESAAHGIGVADVAFDQRRAQRRFAVTR